MVALLFLVGLMFKYQRTTFCHKNSFKFARSNSDKFFTFQVLKNIKSSTCLPFDQLILSRLHPDSVDMCSKLLSRNPGLALYLPQFHIFLLYPSPKLAIYVASLLGPGFSTRLGFYLVIPGY